MSGENTLDTLVDIMSVIELGVKIILWLLPQTHMNKLDKALGEVRQDIQRAAELGLDVASFEQILAGLQADYRRLYIRTHTVSGLFLILDVRVGLMWEIRQVEGMVERLKQSIRFSARDQQVSSRSTSRE